MLRKSLRQTSRRSGFTLIEAMISMTILVIVMVLTMSILFSMRTFGERQQFFTAPRQTARRAMEFVSLTAEGATDLNYPTSSALNLSPNAIVARYRKDASKPAETRATYDNLTTAQSAAGYGDVGTDLITFSVAANPAKVSGVGNYSSPAGSYDIGVLYSGGCPTTNTQINNLMDLLGATWWRATGKAAVQDSTTDPLLLVYDPLATGRSWAYCKIKATPTGVCGSSPTVTVKTTALQAGELGPPGTLPPLPTAGTVYLVSGIQYISFRVNGGNLEQKSGMFDPATDNPGTNFTPIIEDVEDLQIAYIYQDGTVRNDMTTGGGDGTPIQAGPGPPPVVPPAPIVDIASVVALRLNITARSPAFTLGTRNTTASKQSASGKYFRPTSENHTALLDSDPLKFDNRDHYLMTTMVALRNRMLGY